MINFLLAANYYGESIEFLIKNTNDNDLKITEILCVASVIAIFFICVTIYLIMRLIRERKNKSTKRVLEDILKNDQDIIKLLKQQIDTKTTEK